MVFYDGDQFLGNGVNVAENLWQFTIPWDAGEPRSLDAVRASASTDTQSVDTLNTARFALVDPARFIPLDDTGTRLPGEFVELNEDGSLKPFVYIPEGNLAVEDALGLEFVFEAGATLELVGGVYRLNYDSGKMKRGSYDAAPVSLAAGSVNYGPLSLEDAKSLAGLTADDFFYLHNWPGASIAWVGGELTSDQGVEGLQLLPVELAGNLPGDFDGAKIIRRNGEQGGGEDLLALAYSGAWTPLGAQLSFAIPKSDPLTLFYTRAGRPVAAKGGAVARFADGGSVQGSFELSGSLIQFNFAAKSVTIPLLNSLSDLLPDDAEACVSQLDTLTDEQLEVSQACLSAYHDAYRKFIETSLSVSTLEEEIDLLFFDDPNALGPNMLEAYFKGALAEFTGSVPVHVAEQNLEQLQHLLFDKQLEIPALYSFKSVLKELANTMELADKIIQQSNVPGQQQLEALTTLLEQVEAVEKRLVIAANKFTEELTPGEIMSELKPLLRFVTTIEGFYMQHDTESESDWLQVRFLFINQAFLAVLDYYGFPADYTSGTQALTALNRFTVQQALADIRDMWNVLDRYGSDEVYNADGDAVNLLDVEEQVLNRYVELSRADIVAALETNSFAALRIAFANHMEVLAARARVGMPDNDDFELLSGEIMQHLTNLGMSVFLDGGNPQKQDDLVAAMEYMSRMLTLIPDQASTFALSPYLQLAATNTDFFARLASSLDHAGTWFSWLKGNLLETRIALTYFHDSQSPQFLETDVLDVDNSVIAKRITYTVNQLAAYAGADSELPAQKNWRVVDAALVELFNEAEYYRLKAAESGVSDAQRAKYVAARKAMMAASATLLEDYHTIALAYYQDGIGSQGLTQIVDMVLPGGELTITQLAGGIAYNHKSKLLAGRFSGELRMPAFDASLSVPNASLNSRGEFSLLAYGGASLPEAGADAVRFDIPAWTPLVIQYSEAGGSIYPAEARFSCPTGPNLADTWCSIIPTMISACPTMVRSNWSWLKALIYTIRFSITLRWRPPRKRR